MEVFNIVLKVEYLEIKWVLLLFGGFLVYFDEIKY